MNETHAYLQIIQEHLRQLRNRLRVELAARHDPEDAQVRREILASVERSIQVAQTWMEMDNEGSPPVPEKGSRGTSVYRFDFSRVARYTIDPNERALFVEVKYLQ